MSIAGRKKTEKEYRMINMDSSSSLKEFSLDRKKYYKKYIIGDVIEEEESRFSLMGKLVETLLLEPEEFDNRFFLSSCLAAPTGLMLLFVEALCKITIQATDEKGKLCRSFEEIARDAYSLSGFKISFDKVIEKFSGSNNEIYYKEILQVREKGLSVATATDVSIAENIKEELRMNFVTSTIVNCIDSAQYTVYNQLQVEGYDVFGHSFKSMIDKIIIDHKNQTIQVYDLKCTWSVENFYEEYYLYRRAYIQAYLYYEACKHFISIVEELKDYKVLYPKFIVCDSTNYYNPLIYCLDEVDMMESRDGFTHKGKYYPGVYKIIEDLKWAKINNIWNISRGVYAIQGMINIKGGN